MIKCHCAASIRGVAISPGRGAAYTAGLLASVMSSQRFRRASAECRYRLEAATQNAGRSTLGCPHSARVAATGVRQSNPLRQPRTPPSSAQTPRRLDGLHTDDASSRRSRLAHTSLPPPQKRRRAAISSRPTHHNKAATEWQGFYDKRRGKVDPFGSLKVPGREHTGLLTSLWGP
jgi:hypothetical protein